MYPVFLDVKDRLIVIIGGGNVGQRKARSLLTAGARVRIVALEACPNEFVRSDVDWQQMSYASRHLIGGSLVFACATAEVNRIVVQDARSSGIRVNCASDPDKGDFHVPATSHHGYLTIAVGTNGIAPLLAARLKDHLAEQIDPMYADWLELLHEFRKEIRETISRESERRALFERLCDPRWLEHLRESGKGQVRDQMKAVLRTGK